MRRLFFKRFLAGQRALIYEESLQMQDFMHLLMKRRNRRSKWTKEETRQIKNHVQRLSFYVPALAIFMLPFGSLLLPVLAHLLDRRKGRRDT
jgi:hypothetical protein